MAADAVTAAATAAATSLLGAIPASLTLLKGGRNSRVYRVTAGGDDYALKQYFRRGDDTRDRLGTEFAALEFMRAANVGPVPRPIARSDAERCALYEFVKGVPADPREIQDRDIDQCVEFLGRLHDVSRSASVAWHSPASEARFSVAAVIENIEERVAALRSAPRVGASGAGLDAFLATRLVPALARVTAWVGAQGGPSGNGTGVLGRGEQTLSPSDFGVHNAIRRPAGEIVFLDFEYFGWDDPAKLIADYLLHPAMILGAAQKTRFAHQMLAVFDAPWQRQRLAALFPLFGLKWVTILLNEFLPEHLERRAFAGAGGETGEALREAQLEKAAQLLAEVEDTHQRFPYA